MVGSKKGVTRHFTIKYHAKMRFSCRTDYAEFYHYEQLACFSINCSGQVNGAVRIVFGDDIRTGHNHKLTHCNGM